jgi:hypothetical protein
LSRPECLETERAEDADALVAEASGVFERLRAKPLLRRAELVAARQNADTRLEA